MDKYIKYKFKYLQIKFIQKGSSVPEMEKMEEIERQKKILKLKNIASHLDIEFNTINEHTGVVYTITEIESLIREEYFHYDLNPEFNPKTQTLWEENDLAKELKRRKKIANELSKDLGFYDISYDTINPITRVEYTFEEIEEIIGSLRKNYELLQLLIGINSFDMATDEVPMPITPLSINPNTDRRWVEAELISEMERRNKIIDINRITETHYSPDSTGEAKDKHNIFKITEISVNPTTSNIWTIEELIEEHARRKIINELYKLRTYIPYDTHLTRDQLSSQLNELQIELEREQAIDEFNIAYPEFLSLGVGDEEQHEGQQQQRVPHPHRIEYDTLNPATNQVWKKEELLIESERRAAINEFNHIYSIRGYNNEHFNKHFPNGIQYDSKNPYTQKLFSLREMISLNTLLSSDRSSTNINPLDILKPTEPNRRRM